MILPQMSTVLFLFRIFKATNLLNTLYGLAILYASAFLPFTIWAFVGFINQIPKDIEEAAIIDGCGVLGRLKNIIIPVSWPGLTISFIFSFRFAWNEFALPLVFMSSPDKMVFQVAIYRFLGQPGALNYGQAMAMSSLLMLVTSAGFLLLERIRGNHVGEF